MSSACLLSFIDIDSHCVSTQNHALAFNVLISPFKKKKKKQIAFYQSHSTIVSIYFFLPSCTLDLHVMSTNWLMVWTANRSAIRDSHISKEIRINAYNVFKICVDSTVTAKRTHVPCQFKLWAVNGSESMNEYLDLIQQKHTIRWIIFIWILAYWFINPAGIVVDHGNTANFSLQHHFYRSSLSICADYSQRKELTKMLNFYRGFKTFINA